MGMKNNVGKLAIIAVIAGFVLLGGLAFGASAEPGRSRDSAPLLASVGTGFTYQGYLDDGGLPANGSYDFKFTLWDTPFAGTPMSSTLLVSDLAVSDGVFTVLLDFGQVFDGAELWLEIELRAGASTGAYTTLTPRQFLSAVPYALHADSVDGFDVAPKTGYLSIPAAGFRCSRSDGECITTLSGIYVSPTSVTDGVIAPVYLPDGAVVNSVTLFWDDTNVSEDGSIRLDRVTMSDGVADVMAEVSTSGSGGHANASDLTIALATIDNSIFSYHIYGFLPLSTDVKFVSVLIEYTYIGLE